MRLGVACLWVLLAACQVPVPTQQVVVPSPSPSATAIPLPSAPPVSLDALEADMAERVNQERVQDGVAPIGYSADLAAVAEAYSRRMIQDNFFDHVDPQGETVGDRIRSAGLTFKTVGENIGFGSSMAAIQKGFVASATHRAVMLDPRWVEMGIGIERVDEGEPFTGEGDQVLLGDYVVTQIYRLPRAN